MTFSQEQREAASQQFWSKIYDARKKENKPSFMSILEDAAVTQQCRITELETLLAQHIQAEKDYIARIDSLRADLKEAMEQRDEARSGSGRTKTVPLDEAVRA